MDDVEDDARYPPNPYPQNPHHRHHSAHSQRPKTQFSRNFTDQDDEDDEESNSDGIKPHNPNNANNNNSNSSAHHHPDDYMQDGEDEAAAVDDDDDDDSSMESRGKRRKLDNFEFVPRKPVPVPAMASSKPAVKNSPPDWSEDSTFLLLDAWGDLFVKNGRKSLRSDEWSEVAKKVNQASRITRSDSQCRNRLDTLKKKYKKEKARMAEIVNFKSDWVYFQKMDSLMSSPSPVATEVPKSSPLRLACGVDAGEYVFSNSRVYLNRANAMDEMRDSPGDTPTDGEEGNEDDDDSDGLPPAVNEKSKKGRGRSGGSIPSSSFRMLADSIQKFGEVYEKIESSKRQQMMELERMRKEFHRDLELQKRQILERAQAEIARIRQEDEEEEERMTGEGDGDDDEDDEIDGSAENLSS